MSNTRMFLLVGIFAMGFLLWQQWQIDYAPQPAQPRVAQSAADATPDAGVTPPPVDPSAAQQASEAPDEIPTAPAPVSGSTRETAVEPLASEETITVRTDVFELTISTRGAAVVGTRLLDYPLQPGSEQVVSLLSPNPATLYTAQAGVVSTTHDTIDHRQLFAAARQDYVMDGETLVVPLTLERDGVTLTREFRFSAGRYAIDVVDRIENGTNRNWSGFPYRQLLRVQPPELPGNTFSNPQKFSFSGVGLYNEETNYEKFDFAELAEDGAIAREGARGWVAMVQHYFISAWVPPVEAGNRFEALKIQSTNRFLTRTMAPSIDVAPGQTGETVAQLYIGPKLHDQIEPVADGLELTVDYGIFTPFSKVLFWLLDMIYSVVGNWGWAIVLLTVLVKAVFFKLTEAQYKSMAKLRKLQPRIQALKERYGDDREKFNLKMMEIYKTEKVNPLGGCLPVLVQIPVFIALYWVLVESVELRQAPFMLWLNDLSAPDPYFILPLINGLAMFMTTKLSPNPAADPMQQKIMLAMPIVFSVMFAFFQAGLVLYWAVNASLSLAQQWVITKRIDAEA